MSQIGKTAAELTDLMRRIIPNIRHCEVLGIQVVAAEKKQLCLRLPYSEKIVGNPETGVIHGGPLTTLMDTACGFSVVCALEEPTLAPTLDLRIDYMRAAEPGKDVIGKAEAYRVASNVIFCRGTAYHEGDEANPIAHCVATFMRMNRADTPRMKVDGEST